MSTTSAPRRLRGHELLAAVAEGTAGAVGEEFLRCLARNVAEAFAAKMVLIAEADDPSGHARPALACWYDGAFIEEPLEYDTAGQPCAVVADYPWVSFPEALSEHFPDDLPAIELGLQSYLAVCLRSSEDVHLGHIAVLDARPMEASEEDVAALRIFAARASAELERRNQARALEESRARVIEAADAERRRVGRDLHDGAQQRLLAVSNLLRVARMNADEPAEALLATAADELAQAHAELRELARGLHPVALSERGLRGGARVAVRELGARGRARHHRRRAARRPRGRGVLRRGGVARQHARATRRRAASRCTCSRAPASCTSRSPTTASAAPTSAAAPASPGLADRVEVLKGCFDVESPAGGGTRVHASIPLAA